MKEMKTNRRPAQETQLLVDGCNVMRELQATERSRSSGDFAAFGRCLNAVANRADRICHLWPACKATVVFDGPRGTHRAHSPYTSIVPSGGSGSDRADNCIVQDVTRLRSTASSPFIIVVTNDRELRVKALLAGANEAWYIEDFLRMANRAAA